MKNRLAGIGEFALRHRNLSLGLLGGSGQSDGMSGEPLPSADPSSVSGIGSAAQSTPGLQSSQGADSAQSNTGGSSDNASSSSQEFNLMYEYTLDRYLAPFRSSTTIYNETLMFVQNKDGTYDPAPFLYTPLQILSVRSFDLRTTYAEGIDYTVENGKIRLTPQTAIKTWLYDEYYPAHAIEGRTFSCTKGGFIAFGEGRTFIRTQVAVTYTHNDTWKGIIPAAQQDKLKVTLQKLKNKEKTTIAFFGDSISTGANSSGAPGINMLPRAPIWPAMIVQKLKDFYGNDSIVYMNGALGGANTRWGMDNTAAVTDSSPDLVVIAFGMNDPGLSPAVYKTQIESIIGSIRQKNPDAEIILVSTMLPNREVAGFFGNQQLFEQPLKEIAGERSYVAIAPVTAMHTTLLESKRYYDMTGNNVNHPNDFLARMYAQTILEVMIGGD